MTNSTLLEKAIEDSGLTKKSIAKKIGISYGSLRNKIQNITEFKAKEINELSLVLKLSNELKEVIFFGNRVD